MSSTKGVSRCSTTGISAAPKRVYDDGSATNAGANEVRSVHGLRSTAAHESREAQRRKYLIGSQSCHSLIYSIDAELDLELDALETSESETDLRLPPLNDAATRGHGGDDVSVTVGRRDDGDPVELQRYEPPGQHADSEGDESGSEPTADHESSSEAEQLSTDSRQFVDDHEDADSECEDHPLEDFGNGDKFTNDRQWQNMCLDFEEINRASDSKLEDDSGDEHISESRRHSDHHVSSRVSTSGEKLVPIVCGSAKYFWERSQCEAGRPTTVGTRLHQYVNYSWDSDEPCRGECEQHRGKLHKQDSTFHSIAEEEVSPSRTDPSGDNSDDSSEDDFEEVYEKHFAGVNVHYGECIKSSPGGRMYIRGPWQRNWQRVTSTPFQPTNHRDVTPTPSAPAGAGTEPSRGYFFNFASTLKFWQGVERIVVPNFVREAVSMLEDSEVSSEESEREDQLCYGDTGHLLRYYRYRPGGFSRDEGHLSPGGHLGYGDADSTCRQVRGEPSAIRCWVVFTWWCVTLVFLVLLVLLLLSEDISPGIFSKHAPCDCFRFIRTVTSYLYEPSEEWVFWS